MPDKEIISIDKFKKKAKEGKTDNIAVRKQFSIEVKEVDDENRIIEFVASTPNRDRDMDTINAEGWDLTNYEKNPVMLWAHDYSQPPIGKSVENFIQNGELRQKFQFVEKEIYPFADMVYQMYKKGYLNAVSVGFDPKEWDWSDEEEGNIDFRKQELLETSAVPVPANPEALMVAGMDNDKELIKGFAKKIQEWSHKILKEQTKILSEARTPDYEGTETTSWDDVDRTLDDYVAGYYTQNPDAEPESEEEIPETVGDMPAVMKNWIANKSLLGDPDAEDLDNLRFFPVVNPQTDNLNRGALIAVRSGRGQQADIPESTYQSAYDKAGQLLEDEFDAETEEESYQLEVDPTFHKEDDYMIGETECPHCQGKLYMKASEEVLKVNKSEQSDFHLELKDDEEVETEDKIQVNADELSSLIREKVQEQITKKTGKIF